MKKYLITLLILISISGPWTMNPVLKAEEMSLAKADIDKTNESQSVDMSQLMELMKFDGMDVTEALKYLSIRSGMNIVTGKTVTGRVTMILKNVSIQDIFDIILLSNNLAYKKLGTIYYVMTAKDYADLYGESFTDAREIRVFRLKYAIPQKAFELLDILKSKVGKLLADLDTGTILVVDTPEKIAEMEKVLKIAEQKNETGVFSLQYAKAKDIEALLKARIEDKNLGSVVTDERSNQVLIQTLPERMADVEQMIAVLDKKTKEVLIDTKIIKIQLFDEFDAGFEWEGMFKSLGSIGSAGSGFIGSHPLESVLRTGTGYLDT
ncbi:MAG: hypothetical protein KAX15_02105, partial [Candidatus Omnitrophica bacterium]|nr:hypothetical protein [Candidatus Omnitrophota bacterium]